MSIIHDALQKTQQTLKDKSDAPIQEKENSRIDAIDVFLITIITGLFFAIVYAYYSRLIQHSSAVQHVSAQQQAQPIVTPLPQEQLVATPVPLAQPITTPKVTYCPPKITFSIFTNGYLQLAVPPAVPLPAVTQPNVSLK